MSVTRRQAGQRHPAVVTLKRPVQNRVMSEAEAGAGGGREVRRRHVFYIPGYDPRSPRIYFLLFKREFAKWGAANGVRAELKRERAVAETEGLSTWRMSAQAAAGRVDTTFDFLSWHDLAEREFSMSYLQRVGAALEVFWASIYTRSFWDMTRWNWKFGLFAAYPWVMAFAYLLAGAAWMGLCIWAGARLAPAWLWAPAAAAGAVAGLWAGWRLVKRLEPKLYVFYLLNDWIWTGRHRRGHDQAAEGRFERFAERVAQAARAGEADELLIVGHSSGSFVAAIVAARAVELASELGREAPRLNLLTIGANTVVSAGGNRDNPGRRAIAALLPDPRVRWIEFFAPQDIMSFPRLDYRRCYRVDLQGRPQVNPTHLSARFGEIFSVETYRTLLWRWFDLHFAFLKANDHAGRYDLYRMLAGPQRFEAVLEPEG